MKIKYRLCLNVLHVCLQKLVGNLILVLSCLLCINILMFFYFCVIFFPLCFASFFQTWNTNLFWISSSSGVQSFAKTFFTNFARFSLSLTLFSESAGKYNSLFRQHGIECHTRTSSDLGHHRQPKIFALLRKLASCLAFFNIFKLFLQGTRSRRHCSFSSSQCFFCLPVSHKSHFRVTVICWLFF